MQRLKLWVVFLLIMVMGPVFGQNINGLLLDKTTRKPLANATVNSATSLTFSSAKGEFHIQKPASGDTLRITCIGYRPVTLTVGLFTPDTLKVYLDPATIALKQVDIKAVYDPRLDSIRTRKEFSNVFGYSNRGTLKGALLNNSSTNYAPSNNVSSANNATTLASVNLLSVFNYFNRNNTPTAKLQKKMLKDEQLGYVDRQFSREKITSLTSLKGDSLTDFIDKYRPTVDELKLMSDYDMIIYIKKSYSEFLKIYKKDDKSPFEKKD